MAKESKGLLSGGLFAKPIMNSRVKTRAVSKKEKFLGHLLGPLGLIFVVNTIAALVEKFFTQQVGAMYGTGNVEMIQKMGGYYEAIMTVTKVLGVGLGLLIGFLLSRTKSKQGRFRPWYLIFGFMSIIVGALIFLFPGTTLGESYWYYFFFMLICYNTVGSSFFYTFRDNIVSVSTRDPQEKAQLMFIRKMSWTLISGILIGMLVSSVVLPFWLEKDISGYPILLIVLSVVAIPLFLIEYYYTRERIIEDVAEEVEDENKVPLKAQMKALFTNKYWIILTVLALIQGIVDAFKGGNVQYFYIKFMLGGAENGSMYMLYQIITGVPLGLGAIIAYPLAKKFGIKNITFVGYALVLIGSVLGWINSDNIPVAMVAGFLRQFGMIPNAYIFATLMCYAFDSIEYKSGFRVEGLLATAIVGAIMGLIYAPFAGGYESTILKLGFVDAEGVVASEAVKSFMSLSFYLFDIIMAVAFLILIPFVNVEKKLPEIMQSFCAVRRKLLLQKVKCGLNPKNRTGWKESGQKEKQKKTVLSILKTIVQEKDLTLKRRTRSILQSRKKSARNGKQSKQRRKQKRKATI